MKRLTKKNEHKITLINDECGNYTQEDKIYNKLSDLEDIEEELGCPLDLYIKMCVLGTECVDKKYPDVVQWFNKYTYMKDEKAFGLSLYGEPIQPVYYVKDYGKTWVLREDLKND